MANIQKCLEAIKSAIYGEEVRGSIHDAIKSMNEEVVSTVDALGAATETANTAASNANTAAGSANSAANAASAATLESNEATIAANTAAQSANSAAGRAEKASEDCAAAASAANTATTNANNAAGSAASAAENASNAARNAAQSSDKAQQAASDATDASTAANTAAARANAAANNAENIGGVADKTVEFDLSAERTNIESGESVKIVFGKIKKWFLDLGTSAFATISNALNVESSGYVMDARQGKVLKDLIDSLGLNVGDLTALQTTDKDSLVNAINNLADAVSTLNSNLNDKKTLTLDNITIPSGVTIEGGYAKVGRLVYVSIIATVTDTSIDYRISGFPKALRLTALACHVPERCNTCYIDTSGTIRVQGNSMNGMQLSCVYISA